MHLLIEQAERESGRVAERESGGEEEWWRGRGRGRRRGREGGRVIEREREREGGRREVRKDAKRQVSVGKYHHTPHAHTTTSHLAHLQCYYLLKGILTIFCEVTALNRC
mmetsp:Transcript_3334/g.7121  ORF Transcript_3334/g.7121 Transcript_3334/m.7121 type:complete len:109 (+) Transcript_3334:2377-2703(+)